MSYQIIRQPDTEYFGVFSTNTDTFVMWEATRDEVLDFFVREAKRRARIDTNRALDLVETGQTREAYSQFALTWDQAANRDREHNGTFSAEPQETR